MLAVIFLGGCGNMLLVPFAKSQIHKIQFVGRIIDQNGLPVQGASVEMAGGSNYLASGSGAFHVSTDQDGFFTVEKAKGSSLALGSAKKAGYDIHVKVADEYPHFYNFKESDEALLWADYTREHPYVIKAYKVEKYAQVKSENSRYLSFVPNGTLYSVDFSGGDRVKWEGVRDGDIRVSFTRDDKEWKVKIEGINGGVLEAADEYMNMAPDSGYKSSLNYFGNSLNKFNKSRSIELNKSLYFMSNNGKRYGALNLKIIPYFNEEEAGIYTSYVINLEGGRELAVKPKE
jgi:hypothetical protein